MSHDINELKGFNFNKARGIPSAVQIAATISAYAKLSINEFKNIPNNSCIYSDTDSVVLVNKLDDNSNKVGAPPPWKKYWTIKIRKCNY